MPVRKPLLISLAVVVAGVAALVSCVVRGGGYFLEAPPGIAGIGGSASSPALLLPLEVDLPSAEEFVRLGYGLEPGRHFQSTSFLSARLRTVQAQPLVALVKSYNQFEGERVSEALGHFRGRVSAVEFGREGSPVLYIELPYWTHQREEAVSSGMGQRISDEEHKALLAELKEAFVVKLNAREFSEEGRRVRIWWR